MNRKVIFILIISIITTLLVGCNSLNKYSYDYNKISEISTISIEIGDTYYNSSRKSNFKKESKKIVKRLEKTKMKTKEGKDVLKAYVKISKSLINNILDNWNQNPLNSLKNKKTQKLEENLKYKLDKFDEKIEELKVKSGFYETLEQLKN